MILFKKFPPEQEVDSVEEKGKLVEFFPSVSRISSLEQSPEEDDKK